MVKKQVLIDTHAHVQFPAYDADRAAVIERARAAGIGMVNVGTQYSTSEAALRAAEQYKDNVWASAGFHPGHVDSHAHHNSQELHEPNAEPFDADRLRELARHPKVVAIGECGLDYYRIKKQEAGIKEEQQKVFGAQIEIARAAGKPLVIHCRQAFPDLVRILGSHFNHQSDGNGVIHFFSGNGEDAKKLLGLGFHLGFGGVITFARDYDEIIKKTPLDRIVVETDAPYVSPLPYRGKRNEPAYIVETVKKIAELRGILYDEVASATLQNAKHLFRI